MGELRATTASDGGVASGGGIMTGDHVEPSAAAIHGLGFAAGIPFHPL